MPELRKDPITGRWVIISTERGKRPIDFVRESVQIDANGQNCPFCPGSEGEDAYLKFWCTAATAAAKRHAGLVAFASCRINFRRWASKATSIAKAKACSTR